ncbi:hypothetical protein ACOSP7_029558 [Xanthoceras sorbifolium]
MLQEYMAHDQYVGTKKGNGFRGKEAFQDPFSLQPFCLGLWGSSDIIMGFTYSVFGLWRSSAETGCLLLPHASSSNGRASSHQFGRLRCNTAESWR